MRWLNAADVVEAEVEAAVPAGWAAADSVAAEPAALAELAVG